jgi:hypothetical protein
VTKIRAQFRSGRRLRETLAQPVQVFKRVFRLSGMSHYPVASDRNNTGQ